jgi:hypothetical protein
VQQPQPTLREFTVGSGRVQESAIIPHDEVLRAPLMRVPIVEREGRGSGEGGERTPYVC